MKKAIIILFLLSVFFLGFLPVKDTDFGWHYRCGNQFLTTGKLCLSNEFSYFLPHYKAYYTGHLYDVILAFTYNHGGFLAVSILGAFVFVLSAYFFLKLVRGDSILKIPAFLISFFLSYSIFNLGLRPQIISFLFLLILLFVLQLKNKKYFYLIPFLFLIWANLHIGFFVGLAVFVFYIAENAIRALYDRTTHAVTTLTIIIFLISVLTTGINPFEFNVYTEIFNHAASPLNTMIAEWVPPNIFHVVVIIALGLVCFVKMFRRKPVSFFRILLLLFFGVLALKARRNLPFFYVISALVFFNDLKINLEKYTSLFIPLLMTLSIFTATIQVPLTIKHSTSWNEYCNKSVIATYPCEAIKKFPHLSGNVYSTYEWGGFLIWQKPEMKVFVDGRMPAWKDENGKSPYKVYLEIIQTGQGWNEKLRSLKTDYIFITNGTFLDLLLQKDASKYGWREVYRDNLAVIYKNAI